MKKIYRILFLLATFPTMCMQRALPLLSKHYGNTIKRSFCTINPIDKFVATCTKEEAHLLKMYLLIRYDYNREKINKTNPLCFLAEQIKFSLSLRDIEEPDLAHIAFAEKHEFITSLIMDEFLKKPLDGNTKFTSINAELAAVYEKITGELLTKLAAHIKSKQSTNNNITQKTVQPKSNTNHPGCFYGGSLNADFANSSSSNAHDSHDNSCDGSSGSCGGFL